MEGNNEPEDGMERVWQLFDSGSSNFQRILIILVGVSLFFFFAAILPYFSIQFEKHNIAEDRDNASRNINETKTSIANINESLNQIVVIRDKELPKAKQFLLWAKANVTLLDKVDPDLRPAVEKLKKAYLAQEARYEGIVTNLTSTLRSLQANKSNYEKLFLFGTLKLSKLKDHEIVLNETLNDLTRKWQDIQSPIGSLPIGFYDLVSVYPFSIGIGFTICVLVFVDTLHSRRFLHYLHRRSDKTLFTDSMIFSIAPLWVDPLDTDQSRLMKSFLLIIPFILFVVTFAMMSYSLNILNEDFLSFTSEFYQNVYYFVDLLSFGTFIYGYWTIIREIKKYNREIPSRKILLDGILEEHLEKLSHKGKISSEQSDFLLKNIWESKKYLEENKPESALQSLDHFMKQVNKTKLNSLEKTVITNRINLITEKIH